MKKRDNRDLKLEIVEAEPMTEEDVNVIVEILAGWVIKDYESKLKEKETTTKATK